MSDVTNENIIAAMQREIDAIEEALELAQANAALNRAMELTQKERAEAAESKLAEQETELDKAETAFTTAIVRNIELESKLAEVSQCQRYTIHAGAYTTDNPTGKWMKADDVLAAIKRDKP